jgi:hypothetical protein
MSAIEQILHRFSPAGMAEWKDSMDRATSSSRTGMVAGKRYNRITYNKDKTVASTTYVGTFVRNYTMGSGDGMEYYAEFKKDDGTAVRFGDEMWGNIGDVPATYSQVD